VTSKSRFIVSHELGATVFISIVIFGCSHLRREEPARPPLKLPPSLIAPYRPRHPGLHLRLELDPADRGRYYESYLFHFDAFSELEGDFKRVDGKYYRSLRISAGKKGPLLVMAPILAGAADDYLACKIFSRWACANGMSSFYVYQEEDILTPERDGVELERLFRENVQDNIRALDLFLERPEVDAHCLGTFGISMGAIKNVILMAVDPRFE